MQEPSRNVDPLPDGFKSEEEAAEFWETHSLADYEEFLEPVDMEVDLQRRHFQIEVDRESFLALREKAKKEKKPIRQVANEILREKLLAS